MTKEDFSKKISEKTGMSERESYAFLSIVVDLLRFEIANGGEFFIKGFGTLLLRRKKKRFNGVHKKFNKDHWAPFFRPSKEILKDLESLPIDDDVITNQGFVKTNKGKARLTGETGKEYYERIFKKNANKKA